MLDVHGLIPQGFGVNVSVTMSKSKTDRAARRKKAVPPSESLNDPASASSFSPTDPPSPLPTSLPFVNGEDETALARLADDGGPPLPSPAEEETPPEPVLAETPEEAPASLSLSLEERVRRLEEMVTLLQEKRAVPARVASVASSPPPPPEARPMPLPAAPAPPAATAVMLDLGKRLLNASPSNAAPASAPGVATPNSRNSLLWLLRDTWAEARAILRMFLDPRYHLPWSARALPLVVLAAILTSKYWVPGSSIPVLGDWLLVKSVDLLLAFLLFKWLGHEARRYRQTSPDLPTSLRL